MVCRIGWLAAVLGAFWAAANLCLGQTFPEAPLDRLDRSTIPTEELELVGAEKAPDELVAVLGSGKFAHWRDIAEIVVSPDGKFVVTTGGDHVIRIWNLHSGKQHSRFDDLYQSSHGVAFNASGDRLAMCRTRLRSDRTMYSVVEVREFPAGKMIREFLPDFIPDSVAFSWDGARLAAAKNDRIVVWNTENGQSQTPPDQRPADFSDFSRNDWETTTRLAFSPNGNMIVSAIYRSHEDEPKRDAMRVWDAKMGKPIRLISGRMGRAPFLKDGTLLAAQFDGAVQLLDPREGRIVRQLVAPIAERDRPFFYHGLGLPLLLPGHETVALPSGTFFDKKVTARLIDIATGTQHGVVEWPEPPTDPIKALDIISDGKTFLIGGQHRLRFWSVENSREARGGRSPVGMPSRIVFSRDESWLALGGHGQHVAIWDFARADVTQSLETEFKEIKSLAVSPDNRWLIAGGDSPGFVVWDTGTWKEVRRFSTSGSDVAHVHFLEEGRTLLTVSTFGDADVWRATDWQSATAQAWKLTNESIGLGELTVAPAGDQVAATLEPKLVFDFVKNDSQMNGKRSLTLWRFPAGKARQIAIQKPTNSIEFSPDGKMIAGALSNSLFEFNPFKSETGIAVWQLDAKNISARVIDQRSATGLEFSPDGTRLAGISIDGSIYIWDVATWKLAQTISFGPARGAWMRHKHFCYSPSGRHFAVCNANGTVYIFRLQKTATVSSRPPETR